MDHRGKSGRGPLTGRDIAALDFAYARVWGTVMGCYISQRDVPEIDPDELFEWAFGLADGFVNHSRGGWAEMEKKNHTR